MGPRVETMREKDLRGWNRSASGRYVISMCAVIVSSDGDGLFVCSSLSWSHGRGRRLALGEPRRPRRRRDSEWFACLCVCGLCICHIMAPCVPT